MTITITAFSDSPDRGRGLARDMPVRWALAEVGQPHDMRRVSFADMKQPDHLARQPFGQIPTYEDGEVTLFESGAIVLRIADRHPGLLPADPAARARATAWMFAAVGTVEPAIVEREQAFLAERDRDWYAARLPLLDDRIRRRLDPLARRLGDADWLDGDFTAGDLMMISALRRPAGSAIVAEHANLAAYVARGEARPAFRRAFAEQHAAFVAGSTADGG